MRGRATPPHPRIYRVPPPGSKSSPAIASLQTSLGVRLSRIQFNDKGTPKDVYGEATPAKAVTCMDNAYRTNFLFPSYPSPLQSVVPAENLALFSAFGQDLIFHCIRIQ